MDRDEHLNKNLIIKAVINETDLSKADLDHLIVCGDCRSEVDRFKGELDMLEQKADLTAPLPTKRPVLPEEESHLLGLFRPRPVFAAGLTALTALLLVAFIWWPNGGIPLQEETIAQIHMEMDADEQLMAEIEELEGIASSAIYMDESDETEELIEDEFMDFLIPTDNDSVI